MLVGDERCQPARGRTTTALDDRLIRRVHSLHPVAVAVLALVVYVAWGLALPSLLGASGAWRLSFNSEGAIFAVAVFFAWLVPIIERHLRHQRLDMTTDVRQLSAREFEELPGELFRREGWNVAEVGGHGKPDGNIDLLLSRSSKRRIVQCKRWTARDVGVDQIRALGGTLLREGRAEKDGIFVTSAGFTPAAIAEAEKLGIELIDGHELLRRLENAGALGLASGGEHASTAWLCPGPRLQWCLTSPLIDGGLDARNTTPAAGASRISATTPAGP